MDNAPNYRAYHESLTDELYSIKDRVRNLVKHWPTDGESKEVALRSLLRKLLPESMIVGRGFIVSKDDSSTQIDVLITDSRKPTLFKDGDLLIVTPDAVLGVIEVKTRLRGKAQISDVLTKLATIEELSNDVTGGDTVWTGLFIFEESNNMDLLQKQVLLGLRSAYQQTNRKINCVSCGKTSFIRYWNRGANVNSEEPGPVWHSYELAGVAPSYFIGNFIDWVSSIDTKTTSYAWFPMLEGKERFRRYYLPIEENTVKSFRTGY